MIEHPEIPKGSYCYDERGVCPHWELREDKPNQRNGYCNFLKKGDWETVAPADAIGFPDCCFSLLWDQCKECGVNKHTPEELAELREGK